MTFSALQLPFISSLLRTTAPRGTVETVDRTDLRREYIESLLSSDACISQYCAQAMMELFPKEF